MQATPPKRQGGDQKGILEMVLARDSKKGSHSEFCCLAIDFSHNFSDCMFK